MLQIAPGATFEAIATAASGLAGTLGVRIRDNAGANFLARTTAGIAADTVVGATTLYRRSFTAPTVEGQFSLIWDNGTAIVKTEEVVVSYAAAAVASGAGFATYADLAIRLGLTLTPEEITRANSLLELASGLIQDEARQQIMLVTDDVFTMPGTTDERIKLPQRPVVSVASFTIDGVPLTEGSDWYLDGNEIARIPVITVFAIDGLLDNAFAFPLGTGFGTPLQKIEIIYTHGYDADTVPQTLKAICMEAVVRVWVNPGSVARETIAGTTTTYDNARFSPSGLLLTDLEVKKIRHLFGSKAISVTIEGG